MRIPVTSKTILFAACLLFGILSVPSLSMAQTYYVRAGAIGTGDGSSWANACTNFTGSCAGGSLVRGATYYVAAGTYGKWEFTTADSGTSVITIKAATASDHGPASDWSSGYAGQALVHGIWFNTDYWVVNGQSRTGWTSGYNIKSQNTNTSNGQLFSIGCSATAILLGNPCGAGGGTPVSNVTVKYVEVEGLNGTAPSVDDSGVQITTSSSHIGLLYDYIHNVGDNDIQAAYGNYTTVDHCFISYDKQNSTKTHAEGMTYYGSNLTVSNSIWLNIISTAFIANVNGGTPSMSNWDIYGNVFYWDSNCINNAACYVGNGVVTWINGNFSGTFRMVNNTVANIQTPGTCNGNLFYNEAGASGTFIIENNVLYNACGLSESSSGSSLTFDYNSYYGGSNDKNDTSAHKQVMSGDPFVGSSTGDFRLAADMTGSQVGISFPSPYNVDLDNNTRGADGTWDRGAYEFASGTGPPPPPTSLTVSAIN